MSKEPANRRTEIISKIQNKKRQEVNPVVLSEEVIQGNISSLSQAITITESSLEADKIIAAELLRHILPHSGKSLRIGITGVPGAGKSTFIEAFGLELIKLGKKIAVLAVDPSSEAGKGSILGDKTRMNELASHEHAFVRPSPSSGLKGGVARKTRESIFLCESAGFDIILVETVGVGQSETAVRSMVDVFLLISIAGAGDELQGIKRGIMEFADIVVVNKSDGDNIARSKTAKADIQKALHLFPPLESGWIPQALLCSSLERKGLAETWEAVMKYQEKMITTGYFNELRVNQSSWWLKESIQEMLLADFNNHPKVSNHLKSLEIKVKRGEVSVSEASEQLISLYLGNDSSQG